MNIKVFFHPMLKISGISSLLVQDSKKISKQLFLMTFNLGILRQALVTAWKSPVHAVAFLHNKDIICHFGLLLVNSGQFQLTSTTSTTFLHVEWNWWRSNMAAMLFHAHTSNLEGDAFSYS